MTTGAVFLYENTVMFRNGVLCTSSVAVFRVRDVFFHSYLIPSFVFVFIFPNESLKPIWENTVDRGCATVLDRKVLEYYQGHICRCLVVYNCRD